MKPTNQRKNLLKKEIARLTVDSMKNDALQRLMDAHANRMNDEYIEKTGPLKYETTKEEDARLEEYRNEYCKEPEQKKDSSRMVIQHYPFLEHQSFYQIIICMIDSILSENRDDQGIDVKDDPEEERTLEQWQGSDRIALSLVFDKAFPAYLVLAELAEAAGEEPHRKHRAQRKQGQNSQKRKPDIDASDSYQLKYLEEALRRYRENREKQLSKDQQTGESSAGKRADGTNTTEGFEVARRHIEKAEKLLGFSAGYVFKILDHIASHPDTAVEMHLRAGIVDRDNPYAISFRNDFRTIGAGSGAFDRASDTVNLHSDSGIKAINAMACRRLSDFVPQELSDRYSIIAHFLKCIGYENVSSQSARQAIVGTNASPRKASTGHTTE